MVKYRFPHSFHNKMGFPGGSEVKNPRATQETWARSLGREVPLEKGTATQSRSLAWRIPQTEKPGGLQSIVLQKSQTRLED